ncbi:unnamed protein product [Peniophora sp. CBMAI 1063]|nr:unnamed protein product [Peniophora sp. CBMAI 1063]
MRTASRLARVTYSTQAVPSIGHPNLRRSTTIAFNGLNAERRFFASTSTRQPTQRHINYRTHNAPITRLYGNGYRLRPATYSTQAPSSSPVLTRRSLIVHVRGLHPDVDDNRLADALSVCGQVIESKTRARQKDPDAWGSGYVTFASQESVDNALSRDFKDVLGRKAELYAQYELDDTIIVGGLPTEVRPDRVTALFSSCGQVTDIKIHPTLAGQAAGRCHAFIRFSSSNSVDAALRGKFEIAGRRLLVKRTVQLAEDRTIWDDYAASADEIPRTVRVSALPPQINDERLAAIFAQCGQIRRARVLRTYRTGGSLGFAFVEFESPISVDKALSFHATEIAGHIIRVERAPPFRPTALEYKVLLGDVLSDTGSRLATKSIFVGRLTRDVDGTMLRRAFEQFGPVESVLIPKDRATGLSRGYGYVDFASPESVELAVQCDQSLRLDGFAVKIQSHLRRGLSSSEVGSPNSNPNDPNAWEWDY